MFDATMDAAMNTHGLGVQRVYGRSILQRFHGMWSVGGMAAGAAGAIAAGLAIAVAPYLVVTAVVLGAAILAAYRFLLPAAVADAHPETDGVADEPVHLRHAGRLLRVLGPIAMLGILCIILQSAASIWGAVYLTDVLGLAAGIAGAGFVVFITAMAIGRLTNDRWVDRWGGTDVVRVGAVIAGAGVLAAMVADPLGVPFLAFVGFAAIGYGSASFFPVMILRGGIAARHPDRPRRRPRRVARAPRASSSRPRRSASPRTRRGSRSRSRSRWPPPSPSRSCPRSSRAAPVTAPPPGLDAERLEVRPRERGCGVRAVADRGQRRQRVQDRPIRRTFDNQIEEPQIREPADRLDGRQSRCPQAQGTQSSERADRVDVDDRARPHAQRLQRRHALDPVQRPKLDHVHAERPHRRSVLAQRPEAAQPVRVTDRERTKRREGRHHLRGDLRPASATASHSTRG